MFGKKKKQNRTLTHPQLGELRYKGLGWAPTATARMELWDKTYEISLEFIAEEEEEPNRRQEEAFEKFNRILPAQKDAIEQIILKCTDWDGTGCAGDRFIPRDASFSRKGECVLFFEDTQDTQDERPYGYDLDMGFALFLLPKLEFGPTEYFFDCIIGYESIFTERELYGE